MASGKTYNLTIYLMKESVHDFKQCIKRNAAVFYNDIKSEYGLDGEIVTSNSNATEPRWKNFLQAYSQEQLNVDDNISNKAIMLIRIKERILALTFGYGRVFLREENIERNFGFITALNMLDSQKIRSINAVTVEDLVVHVQKQSSYSTGQEEFSLDTINDIMMSVTGKAKDAQIATKVSGKDSLNVTVEMEIRELKDKLERYLIYYEKEDYKEEGFSWEERKNELKAAGLGVMKNGVELTVDILLSFYGIK